MRQLFTLLLLIATLFVYSCDPYEVVYRESFAPDTVYTDVTEYVYETEYVTDTVYTLENNADKGQVTFEFFIDGEELVLDQHYVSTLSNGIFEDEREKYYSSVAFDFLHNIRGGNPTDYRYYSLAHTGYKMQSSVRFVDIEPGLYIYLQYVFDDHDIKSTYRGVVNVKAGEVVVERVDLAHGEIQDSYYDYIDDYFEGLE